MNADILNANTQGNSQRPALLFFHAFPLSAQMWHEQMHRFSEKFFCVALDLPGFGQSVALSHAVTFEYYVDAVLNYLKKSKIEKAVWCGLSMGGYLALRLYERAPEMCRGLILCDTKAGADGNEAKVKRWTSIQALHKNRAEFTAAQWQALVGASSQDNSALKNRFNDIVGANSKEGISAGLVALATRNDSLPMLAKIRVPALIIVGDEDKVTPVSESEAMAQAIAGSQLKVLAKTGHLSNLESPHAFNDCVSDFLKALPSL